jgi:hypothetical protein
MTRRAILMLSCSLLLAGCTAPSEPATAAAATTAGAPHDGAAANAPGRADPALAAAARADLLKAVTCDGDPLERVRHLAAKGAADFPSGIATATLAADETPVEVVVLAEPIAFHDARARVVFGDAEQQTGLFPGAIVYAAFDGDFRQAVAALGLQPNAPGGEWEGVGFTDAAAKRKANPADVVCPPTVLLSPIDDRHFYLGCGRCNG